MTIEEITRTLQTVAENQARHSAEIAEIDRMFAASLRSQNRYDERLALTSEIMHDLADKQLKNEEFFAELVRARDRHEARMALLESSYEMFDQFVRDFWNETYDHFAETDKRLAELASAQEKTDEQIKALTLSQARTDKQIRHLLERNCKPKVTKTKPAAKKASKKGGAR